MTTLPAPEFFDTDPNTIVDALVSDYETLTGIKLAPGQAERLLINAIAYRFHVKDIQSNEAAKQNLLAYARYPMLDYLGELVGVERLPAEKATCTIQFNMVAGHPALVIPSGVRIQTIDGKVVFVTLVDVAVLSTDSSVLVQAQCTTEGNTGNKYPAGEVSIILDPQAYVYSALNTGTTGGAADQETDDGLRERIRLAPSSFSSAGPDDAYIFHAKSANPSIIDVGIISPVPGQVNVYPLTAGGGVTSEEVINEVYAKLNNKKVRPLTDTVIVQSPGVQNYSIVVDLTLLTGTDVTIAVTAVTTNLKAYAEERKLRLGVDAVRSQIVAKSALASVYNVSVVSPSEDIEVDFDQVAFCTGITVNVTGFRDE
jgi:phage-related baseplate assembly protein